MAFWAYMDTVGMTWLFYTTSTNVHWWCSKIVILETLNKYEYWILWFYHDFFNKLLRFLQIFDSDFLTALIIKLWSGVRPTVWPYGCISTIFFPVNAMHHIIEKQMRQWFVILMTDTTHTHTHTHTRAHTRLTALCPGLPGWAGTRKVKPILILLKQETVIGSGISWAVCKSAPRSRQT